MTLEQLYDILKQNTEFKINLAYNYGEIKKHLYIYTGSYDNYRLEIGNDDSYTFLYCEREYIDVYETFSSENDLCMYFINYKLDYDKKINGNFWNFLKKYSTTNV